MNPDKEQMNSAVQSILDEAVATGNEAGLQCAAYLNGELVADAWAGTLRRGSRNEVNRNSLFPVFSAGKAVAATAVLRLVERGVLSLDTRIADVWPEFAANGKSEIRLHHILTHRSGLFETPPLNSPGDLTNWNLMCSKIAQMTPAYEPGSKTVYQSLNFTWLLGETARRADGRDFDVILREEILDPLGIADSMYFGLPETQERRVASPERGPDLLPPKPGEITMESRMNTPAVRAACLPAFNCLTSARALALFYTALLGDLPGHAPLLGPDMLNRATALNRSPNDPAPLKPGAWEVFGLGFVLYGPPGNRGRVFGHSGYGGADGLADRKTHLTVAFTQNIMHAELRFRDRIYNALGMKSSGW